MSRRHTKYDAPRRIPFDKLFVYFLVSIIVLLQYPLWLGSGSVLRLWSLDRQITKQKKDNELLHARNKILEAEVQDLKKGKAALEERARLELGMIKKGETFYHIVDRRKKKK